MADQDLLNFLEAYLSPRRKALFDKVLTQRTNYFTVATQDVYQLHNTSAVIRSCDVFGIQNIHVIEEKQSKQIGREIALGAQKWVDVNRYDATQTCIESLRKQGYRIVATSPHEDSVLLDDFDISAPAAFFFGTEKQGLSPEVLKEADTTLKIPMVGFTESLNISVSAAIILQSLTNKLKQSSQPWQLSEDEMRKVKMQWTIKSIKNVEELIRKYQTS